MISIKFVLLMTDTDGQYTVNQCKLYISEKWYQKDNYRINFLSDMALDILISPLTH